jgi:transglutaminase-like putative cysteine protease
MSAAAATGARPAPPSTELLTLKPHGRGDFWFRLFNHATLALAGVCLVHGEAYFIPWLPVWLFPYLVLLVAAFGAEGRWTMPEWMANVAGVGVVVVMALWVKYQPGGPGVLKGLEVWVRLVPYVGPFMMALLAVQLFRPRGPNDFWFLQGMGLVQVALGCVLASSPLFGLLMAVYLTCAIGCLALHYLSAPGMVGTPPSWRWLAGFVGRYSLVVAASSLVVFLFTPRPQGAPWDPLQRFGNRTPHSARWAAPGGPFQGANLNGTSPVELSNDEVFTLRATDARGPKLDLSPAIRFRTMVLEAYQDGVWPTDTTSAYREMRLQHSWDKEKLPDFGPGQYFLNFEVRTQSQPSSTLVLAEPVTLGPRGERRKPVVLTDFAKPHSPLFYEREASGTLLPVPTLEWSKYRYRQVMAPGKDPDRMPAELSGDGDRYVREITKESLPNLDKWTTALLRRLASDSRYGIHPAALAPYPHADPRRPDPPFLVPPIHRERVALALCKFLANSGEYTYSLDQPRKNLNIDPVEDFLFNVKQGHCERYASALVLMLRTQGIPARLIKGYRGCESLGGGAYAVRENMAHAWVEVMVTRRRDGSGPPHEWLTLDPTPGIDAPRQQSVMAEWLKEKTNAGASMWDKLIVRYNAKSQADVLSVMSPPSVLSVIALYGAGLVLPPLAVLGGLATFLILRVRRSRRVVAGREAGAACYARLVRLLARRGRLKRAAWQTPRELAAGARGLLTARPLTAALADLPDRVVDLFYRVRYGGQAPEPGEVVRLNARLDELATALRRAGPVPSGAPA